MFEMPKKLKIHPFPACNVFIQRPSHLWCFYKCNTKLDLLLVFITSHRNDVLSGVQKMKGKRGNKDVFFISIMSRPRPFPVTKQDKTSDFETKQSEQNRYIVVPFPAKFNLIFVFPFSVPIPSCGRISFPFGQIYFPNLAFWLDHPLPSPTPFSEKVTLKSLSLL